MIILCVPLWSQRIVYDDVLSAPITESKYIFYCSGHLLKQILPDTIIVIGYLNPVAL